MNKLYTKKNLEHLAEEICKCVNGLSPAVMNDFFSFRENPISKMFSTCIPTIRKLLNMEPKVLHTGDHRLERFSEFFLHLFTLFFSVCNHTEICWNFKASISVFCFARKYYNHW